MHIDIYCLSIYLSILDTCASTAACASATSQKTASMGIGIYGLSNLLSIYLYHLYVPLSRVSFSSGVCVRDVLLFLPARARRRVRLPHRRSTDIYGLSIYLSIYLSRSGTGTCTAACASATSQKTASIGIDIYGLTICPSIYLDQAPARGRRRVRLPRHRKRPRSAQIYMVYLSIYLSIYLSRSGTCTCMAACASATSQKTASIGTTAGWRSRSSSAA